MPGQALERPLDPLAGAGEERVDEVVEREPRLAHERAQRGRAPEPPQPGDGKACSRQESSHAHSWRPSRTPGRGRGAISVARRPRATGRARRAPTRRSRPRARTGTAPRSSRPRATEPDGMTPMSTSGKATRNATSDGGSATRARARPGGRRRRRTTRRRGRARARGAAAGSTAGRRRRRPPRPRRRRRPRGRGRARAPTVAPSSTFAATSSRSPTRPRDEAADDVLVALRRDRPGGEQHAHEGERQRERVGLELRAEQPRAPGLAVDLRARSGSRSHEASRPSARARGAPRCTNFASSSISVERLGVVGAPAQLLEQPARLLEPDDVELLAEEVRLAALDEQRTYSRFAAM